MSTTETTSNRFVKSQVFPEGYDVDPNAEALEYLIYYAAGGLCPVTLGQILNGRYKVFAKIGAGSYSTVWLARDITVKSRNCWVALKILRSDESGPQNSELSMLRTARGGQRTFRQQIWDYVLRACCLPSRRSPPTEGRIIRCRDSIWIQSANGSHLCLVLDMVGPTVYQYIRSFGYHQWTQHLVYAETALQLCYGSVLALKALHDRECAQGDISTNNFALGLRDLAGVSEEAMRQLLGEPELGHVSALDGSPLPASLPPYLVHPVDMTRLIPMSDSSMVKMIDLGEAFRGSAESVGTTFSRAPELLADEGATVRTDIWHMGCVMFEIITKIHQPFSGIPGIMAKQQATYYASTPEEQWQYLREKLGRLSYLEYDLDIDLFASLLVKMLARDPSQRPTATEVLNDEFFKVAGRPPEDEAPDAANTTP